ncbi:MAG: ACT domain-containing protein [Lachnospiraceae bacterium]|nr:ACT domain-containing protein [Lachnospiraceae bacterium]
MFIKQLSVFIENREGRLGEVLTALKDNNINIVSLSLADTSDYGMLRMITSNPEEAKSVLKEKGFSAMLTDVLAVKLQHKVGELQEVLEIICKAGINVEYMYALATRNDDATIVIKTSNAEEAALLLQKEGAEFLTSSEI